MSSLPDDVQAYYTDLAQRRDWSYETIIAVRTTVDLIRELDRGTASRTYGAVAGDDGTDWLFEAVWHEREWVVVRQLGVGEDGEVARYWWQRIEDDEGMLTDKALEREEWGLRELSREDFYTAWDDPGWSLGALTA
ncbi:hypothetical protein GCM10029976_089080 [Kribbella albertanoniae]|uniref:Uncharacterized protein n=1 Tax=Kribbella albertanoniae TaxID=1266829 RepID=A0A4R4PH41_9ACTN|nr:hypothetical protein [Kribbella albertanoniae]TDC21134.1 hypothetical protein E1261_34050 [Kribbella albertanoniae]